jgi:hypothetical protein
MAAAREIRGEGSILGQIDRRKNPRLERLIAPEPSPDEPG